MLERSSFKRVPNLAIPAIVTAAPDPVLLAFNESLAEELGLSEAVKAIGDPVSVARFFSGGDAKGAVALAYAGHQFGQFVPRLGDGRAALLGEVTGRDGQRYDVQLKGSGATPFSRGGDGKSAIGPVIREYVVSEAMHSLGVPTTRALAAVATGESVLREEVLPGAVFTRVARSHLRVGTFEYFAAQGDSAGVQALVDYAIARHYPELDRADATLADFLEAVAERQAALVAAWMSVGFIHGVMNTDNTSIAGETLDYGPCAFMDEFSHDKVFSSIDRYGRYAFSNQPPIAQWNMARLADCLMIVSDERDAYETIVRGFLDRYEEHYIERMRAKLGLRIARPDDAGLVRDFLDHLEAEGLDYTLSFRKLADRVQAEDESTFGEFESRWRRRLREEDDSPASVLERMQSVNPLYIPRNHRVEQAIQRAIEGDHSVFEDLVRVLARPYAEQPEDRQYAEAPAPDERVTRTFCGT